MRRLDDGCLVEIFAWLGDVRHLVRCSLVCKQWNSLCWAVPALHFEFRKGSKISIKEQEDIVSKIIQRTPPNCLNELKVFLAYGREAKGEWIVRAGTSLKKLELILYDGRWGPAVWSAVSSLHCLESLSIDGDFFDMSVPPKGLQFKNLTSCLLSCAIEARLLEALVAASPVLKNLVTPLQVYEFKAKESITLSSATLESLELNPCLQTDLISLDTPMLVKLKIDLVFPVMLQMSSTEKLRKLELHQLSVICTQMPFEKLEKLKVAGDWTCEAMLAMLRHTPTVTELTLHNFKLREPTPMPIGQALGLLCNLKTLNFCGSTSVQSFSGDSEEFVFDELTVHLRLRFGLRNDDLVLDFFKSLLGVHCIRRLVVYCDSRFLDERWRILLELALLHPARVELRQDLEKRRLATGRAASRARAC